MDLARGDGAELPHARRGVPGLAAVRRAQTGSGGVRVSGAVQPRQQGQDLGTGDGLVCGRSLHLGQRCAHLVQIEEQSAAFMPPLPRCRMKGYLLSLDESVEDAAGDAQFFDHYCGCNQVLLLHSCIIAHSHSPRTNERCLDLPEGMCYNATVRQ